MPIRVHIVDPAAQTPPYDRSLAAALARAGADVELITSHFVHGQLAEPDGFRIAETFYRRSSRLPSNTLRRRALGALEHLPGMLRHRRAAAGADVVHYQWLTAPAVDARLLPRGPARVMTAHGFLRGAESGPSGGPALERMDAIVALSEYGAGRLHEAGADPARLHVIPHGAFNHLARMDPGELPGELEGSDRPVILCFGLIRPYKGVDVLLRAFAEVEDAELWIVGRPLRTDLAPLERLADAAPGPVRIVPRYVEDSEVSALFRRADLIVLPYRDVEQSGVLYTALPFGKPIVASAVGGFPEVAGALGDSGPVLRLVPPGDPDALATALRDLLADSAERERLGSAAAAAAEGPYSWDAVAGATMALYRRLLG